MKLSDLIKLERVNIIEESPERFSVEYQNEVYEIGKGFESYFNLSASSMALRMEPRLEQKLQPEVEIFQDETVPSEFKEVMMFHEIREQEYKEAGFEDGHERAINDELLYVQKFFDDVTNLAYLKFAQEYRKEKTKGRVEPAEPEETVEEREETISEEPIILTNLSLYDLEGKPVITYKKVILDGEAVKKDGGGYPNKTADGWTSHYQARTDRKILPSLPLFYAVIERMEETTHPGKAGLLNDLEENWLANSTRLNYEKNIITHSYGFEPLEMRCKIPLGDHYLGEIKDNDKWKKALQALLMPKDLEQAIEVLNNFSGVRPCIWTPDKDGRKSFPERAVWLDAADRLYLNADFAPDVRIGRSRGVVVEK